MEDWIQKLTSGSSADWDDFLTSFSRLIYKVFCTRSFGFSRDEIEELFNDFLVSLMEKDCRKVRLFQGRNQCSFASYLKRIAINMAIDRRKKLNRQRAASLNKELDSQDQGKGRSLQDLIESDAQVPEDELIDQEEAKLFLEALYQLSPQRMIVVILIVYHDYDREALGSLLKTTRQNVDVIFNRSKEQLKTLLNKSAAKDDAGRTPWRDSIVRCRERILLGDRPTLLEKCIQALTPPVDLLTGLVFLNALVLHPTPERLCSWIEGNGKGLQLFVEKTLKKIAP